MSSTYLQSSDSQTNKILLQIDENLRQLKTNGITYSNRKPLTVRLRIAWGEDSETELIPTGTAWRKSRAREVYAEFQKASDYLFLPAVMAITPTDCTKKTIENVLDHVVHIEDYEPFHFNLDLAAKKFLETIAVEQGFSGHRGYLNFMQALWPKSEDPRQIQLAYTSIPLDNIDMLFQIMRKGIETSKQWSEERQRREGVSGFVTALIPTGDKDCCFTVNVGREDMMEGLRRLQLLPLRLS